VKAYLSNSLLGIDAEAEAEAAEMLGHEPPVFIGKEDLLQDMQEALIIYDHLPDRIDSMNGIYLGKDLSLLKHLFEIFNVTELEQEILGFILVIESTVVQFRADKAQQESKNVEHSRPRPTG